MNHLMLLADIPKAGRHGALKTVACASKSTRDFTLTRVIPAPRAVVFRAWTEPDILAEWWGPHAFVNPVCEMDARPDGRYRIVMRCPEGVDYPITGTFQSVIASEKLVMTLDLTEHPAEWRSQVMSLANEAAGGAAVLLLQTITFSDFDGHTSLTIRTQFQTSAQRDAFLKMGMSEGWTESLDSLAALLPQI